MQQLTGSRQIVWNTTKPSGSTKEQISPTINILNYWIRDWNSIC